jgi:DNA-binding NtrC family response regulator
MSPLEGRVICLVEDDPIVGESLVQSLSLEGCRVDWWQTGSDAIKGLRATRPDLVVCDIRLPDIDGASIFAQLASSAAVPPFLFVTAYGDIDQAVALMRAGAGDYLTKPFEIDTFIKRARSLIQRYQVARAGDVLGISEEMREIEAVLRRISTLTNPVLITGETGTGKEVCARFLHHISPRYKEPFVAVNCAAIPGDVMERELFGSGGSGPQGFHRGYAERARSGILFLDEVGGLPLVLQAKLLRLVECREFHRVGGEQLVQFHGRIVCSTNADLVNAIRRAAFRDDLYYRINVVQVEVPPLRKRRDDIPWFMDRFFEQFRGEGQNSLRGIGTLAQDVALEYQWPGNVRELRNRIERASVLAAGQWIMPSDMFPELETSRAQQTVSFATLSEIRNSAERRQIERALRQTQGQITETAKLLGVSRTTLWEKMKRLGLSS